MSFFELFDQVFELNRRQIIKPGAFKLYIYWLHEFNHAYWPPVLYRRGNQVYAELGMDKNTLGTAVEQLEARGLLAYEPGKHGKAGEWFLNYEPPTAAWVSRVKNSPCPSESGVKNSPQTAESEVKNSPSIPPQQDETLDSRVKNSPPIKNKQNIVLEENKTPPPASAWVGEAAEKIAHAPLPTEPSELVPPVAEPPHAAESRPVAAAELPAALQAEVKALATEMGQMWKVNEQRGFASWQRLYAFAKHHAQQGSLLELRRQLAGYVAGHLRLGSGIRPHQLDKWLGSPTHPDGPYSNGQWCGCDWVGVAAQVQVRPGQPEQSARATTTTIPTLEPQEDNW